jgi:predicted enzyme related to lactoylglutathione lyase
MASRKPAKRRAKKTAKKKTAKKVARKVARKAARKATKKTAKKRTAQRRPARKAASSASVGSKMRQGLITHTELASADPLATRSWCEKVLGWKFGEAMPTPAGPYHMWRFPNATGGGIRANNPPEVPGSIPYCEVTDIRATYSKALAAGAMEMFAPEALPGGMGWIAIVAAPGGVAIGFWSMK